MPAKSKSQSRLAHAVLAGKSDKMPRDVARDYAVKSSSTYRRLPERKTAPRKR